MPVTANSIVTPQAIKTASAVPVTANSTYSDTPTNTVLLLTAGLNGGRLTRLVAIPRATVTATQLQLYSSTDAGVTKRLIFTSLMNAYTMAQTTQAPATDFGFSDTFPLLLLASEALYVGIGVSLAGGIAFRAEYGDY